MEANRIKQRPYNQDRKAGIWECEVMFGQTQGGSTGARCPAGPVRRIVHSLKQTKMTKGSCQSVVCKCHKDTHSDHVFHRFPRNNER